MSGNPAGRPRGSRHAALVALDAIGHDNASKIMQVVVDAALKGDVRASIFLTSRLWPQSRSRTVHFDLPEISSSKHLAAALDNVASAVADGELTPDEGASLAKLLEYRRRAFDAVEQAPRDRRVGQVLPLPPKPTLNAMRDPGPMIRRDTSVPRT
jgi:hypothetical protein